MTTLQLEMNLAAALEHSDRKEGAVAMQGRVLDHLIDLAGEGHPQTLITRTNLAVLQMKRGLTEESTELGAENLRLALEH